MYLLYNSCVCVLHRSSTRRHPAHPVSVLILHPRKISSVVTSYDTEIMRLHGPDPGGTLAMDLKGGGDFSCGCSGENICHLGV